MAYVEIIDGDGNVVFCEGFDCVVDAKEVYNIIKRIDLKVKIRMVDGTTVIEMTDKRGCATVDEILDELEADDYVILCDKDGNPYISGDARKLQISLYSYVLDRKAIKVGRKIKIF